MCIHISDGMHGMVLLAAGSSKQHRYAEAASLPIQWPGSRHCKLQPPGAPDMTGRN
jgi:hypothetical protein